MQMNDSQNNSDYEQLTNHQFDEIDALSDRFDQDLVNGNSPRIETFLTDAPEAASDGLLAELLVMEIEYRIEQGDEPQPDEYVQRFPGQESLIVSVFTGEAAASAGCSDTQFPGNDTISSLGDVSPDLGNFRLIEEIGHGGMGIVWLAEQIKPVKRRVALKLIKSELASKEAFARFDAEKQALAMMEHQNIARVLDAGTTDDNRPYFVMELVDGVPITQYCDDNKLSVDERLKLFVSVCKAVQHAHLKGIIHRDLKPSNVLVTVIDGEAVPKVIDFGLAKAVEQNVRLTDETMLTEFGKVVGTVQYMSPEQAELKGTDTDDVDTRTDVYSLGVMLYELLTGSTPVHKETLGRNALLEILEIIRENDPPRPSHRLSSSSNEVNSEVSDRRRLHPARLQQLLQGDLDWVVMKALEKDRTRRYQTANDLAQDINNYLSGDAVAARPPSTWYQTKKFAARNRGLVAAMLAVGAALLTGIAGTTYGLIRANEKTELAEDKSREADIQRGKAVKARETATAESQRARDAEAGATFQLAVARWDDNRATEARSLLHQVPPEYRDNFEWHYCKRQFQGSDVTCYGHTNIVYDVAFTPDGKQVASASADGTVKLWDTVSGRALREFKGHLGVVSTGLAVSPDGTRIASACHDATIKLLDSKSGEITLTLKGHAGAVTDVAFSPAGNQLASASADKTVKVWDTVTGEEVRTLRGHAGAVHCLAFSPDGRRIASVRNGGRSGYDVAVRIWDSRTGESLRVIRPQRDVRCLAFSPDGTRLAAAGLTNYVLWDTKTWERLAFEVVDSGLTRCIAFSPDGTLIATAGTLKNIKIWEAQTGRLAATLSGHADEVWGLTFSPDGSRLASTGGDKTVKIWNTQGGNHRTLRGHLGHVHGAMFSADGTQLASVGGTDGTVILRNAQTGELQFKSAGHTAGINELDFASDGARLATAADDNTIRIWNTATGEEIAVLEGHAHWASGVAYSPDATKIVSSSRDGTIKLWDAMTLQETTTIQTNQGSVYDVAFNHDGSCIASAGLDKTTKLWSVQTGSEIRSFTGHSGRVRTVALDRKGKRLVTGGWDKYVRIWNVDSGEQIATALSPIGGVNDVAFSPDGERIVACCGNVVQFHDASTGDEIVTFSTSKGVYKATYSDDGTRLAVSLTPDKDTAGIVLILDAPRSHETAILRGHSGTVTNVSFSRDGRRIYSESDDGEKLVWNLATREVVPGATWNPPEVSQQTSAGGRWFATTELNNVVLVDLEFKNTPDEKGWRTAKASFDLLWHQEQAAVAVTSENWYAAVFHFAFLMKHDPDQAAFYDGLQSSFQELKSKSEHQEFDFAPYLPPVVNESLKLPRGNQLPEVDAGQAQAINNAAGH